MMILVLSAVSVLATSLFLGTASAQPEPETATQAGDVVMEVPASYTDTCGRCHADDGAATRVGSRLNVPDLRTPDIAALTPEEVSASIVEGREGMPAAEDLDEATLNEIVEFTVWLADQPPAE